MAAITQIYMLLLFASILCFTSGKVAKFVPKTVSSDSAPGEKWSYTEVRPGAMMFSWLYYTTHIDGHTNRPWIIWLQGGPGLSSTGLGNFAQFGPVDTNLNQREPTWVQTASVLYIDNPVGCGYSYVNKGTELPSNTEEISQDLVTLISVFLHENPEFRNLPLYVFGQSYGGKMAVGLGYHLQKAISQGRIRCDLAGVGIGNGYVSPGDFIVNFPTIITSMGLQDEFNLKEAELKGEEFLQKSLQRADPNVLSDLFSAAVNPLFDSSMGISPNLYNFMRYHILTNSPQAEEAQTIYDLDLNPLMNGPIRSKLSIIPQHVNWTGMYGTIYGKLSDNDFHWPVFDLVDYLLQESDVKVVVYEGQLDIVCNAKGAMEWIQRLKWPGLKAYNNSTRTVLTNPDTQEVEMILHSHGNLAFYLFMGVGHTVPNEAPEAALRMVEEIIRTAPEQQTFLQSIISQSRIPFN